jgi:hypothetical protein
VKKTQWVQRGLDLLREKGASSDFARVTTQALGSTDHASVDPGLCPRIAATVLGTAVFKESDAAVDRRRSPNLRRAGPYRPANKADGPVGRHPAGAGPGVVDAPARPVLPESEAINPQTRVEEDPLPRPGGVPFETDAVRDSTSTAQTRVSPGSSPSTVATDCGTVVFKESEAGEALKALDSNDFGNVSTPCGGNHRGHKSGLSRGRRLDLIIKYYRGRGSIDRSMSGTQGPWDAGTEERAIRLVTSHREAVRPQGRVAFRVRSSDGSKSYDVAVDPDGWSCTCPRWEDLRSPCKHIVATVRWLDPNPVPLLSEADRPRRRTYRQPDWGKYDEGQQLEHQQFDRLLWDLLGTVPERLSEVGKRGRRAIPLRTQILMAVRKVHLNMSTRRARGLMVVLNQDGKGILPRVANYSVPSRFFNRPQAPRLLLGLIEQSGLALREIEDKGTVAIDSSGFCTTCMGAYCTETHEPTRRHKWVKVSTAPVIWPVSAPKNWPLVHKA